LEQKVSSNNKRLSYLLLIERVFAHDPGALVFVSSGDGSDEEKLEHDWRCGWERFEGETGAGF